MELQIQKYVSIAIFVVAFVGFGYYGILQKSGEESAGATAGISELSSQNEEVFTEITTPNDDVSISLEEEATLKGSMSDNSVAAMNKDEPEVKSKNTPNPTPEPALVEVVTKKTLLAGGCFWCVEADLQKYTGVIDVVSGYAGGSGENPTYKDYAKRGFREVVEVTYDPRKVSYANLVEYVIRHSDATDPSGSFYDRGIEYSSAAYYSTSEENLDAEKVVATLNERKIYEKPLALYIEPIEKFWPAEEYHQDYSIKNPLKYSYYRSGSRRDAFIKKHWGEDTVPTPTPEEVVTNSTSMNSVPTEKNFWITFVKPSEQELQSMLTPLQYKVTQEEGTESPFNNEYDKNIVAGIYVDIVSGEPLFSSKDKFDSGTGWPSFVEPIVSASVVEKVDKGIFSTRTEIRSTIADSHLGHVFGDGPQDRGGKRYCMNSAAMKFIAKEDMERLGYSDYLKFVP